MALRIRRGTTSQRTAVTPASGELVFDTNEVKLYVGNGSTAGGVPVVAGVVGGNLGSNLNLNNFDVIGTGNININGTITATGNINLGDTDADNIVFGGEVNSNIVPNSDSNLNLGSSSKYWNNLYANSIVSPGVVNVQGDILPTVTQSNDIGSPSLKWKNINAESLVLNDITINQNDITTNASNANLNISASGTGSIVLSQSQFYNSVLVGIESGRVTKIESIGVRYKYNPNTGTAVTTSVADRIPYTQLASTTQEVFPITGFDSTQTKSFTVFVTATNSQGTQVFRATGYFFGNSGEITTLLDDHTHTGGISIINDISLSNAGGNLWNLNLETTAFINAGVTTTIDLFAQLNQY